MSGVSCSRCGDYAHDFCATCGEPLCREDMQAGCCGIAPAASGVENEYADQLDAVQSAAYSDMGFPQADLVSTQY